ncbi:quinone-dependent dihydroorotate dehydrogenase [Pseudoalteromonas sp. SR43-6]|jgi:dihydroorotate dehydrogenase|uniref:quinone-dependent dihydroorotate dehydrogenase n=1 Tax=Pseudoalteromonas TaxID=53246 RepID=UPI00020A061D|nr:MULTISPECIES: quinone-dependent dihydroorotate dehydrogenase [Pseudoalteromonas]EGI71984.1 dihydroorotate dehydrogenase [Pseudoalteromonas distincta]MBB1287710.1 quinone-dependent dihydroorotate dehydrogenase [Pseudoalteromonas sp. SR41-5]MBB1329143.1 quinone-dependent dihydroorotate dehydrogenase [Pseudoalteromonas sp. SR43-7]MBB1336764.1 quinone-dependent dihydroorotate dehydrogenase [Pseudoalteromonas sp. SR44-2]MBB1373160.1 quinone-dependent dihydroorotate dehydrogenase [Pseudoalteromon|tara:strand:- start:31215 stop:32225 length:1011 start_codon:yes stop_codon:yes gene_type:complete
MFYDLARRFMFTRDAEWAHEFALNNLRRFTNTPLNLAWSQNISDKPVDFLGLKFKNPVGLAAGLDKNAECIDAFSQMGFGFIEVGTITPRAQAGNDKPRIFRLPESNAIINRMGFNNKGVDNLVANVKAAKYSGILGINIGKNKDTPNEQGKDDYIHCMRKVFEHASYITVNISSPNTPGLRDLQYGAALDDLLQSLKNEQLDLVAKHNKQVPMLVKIAPDLDQIQIEQVSESLLNNKIDGVIATNTTLERAAVMGQQYAEEAGGLSGHPVRMRSTEVVSELKRLTQGKLPIIGVGGIDDAQSAKEKFDAGANLVQVYTGFIYKGPQLVKSIVNGL